MKNLVGPGQTIEIAVDSPAFDFMWAYINKRKDGVAWKARIKVLTSEFDPAKFAPLFYCCVHRRFEDGTHRLHIAKIRGQRTVRAVGHAHCFHKIMTLVKTLLALIAADPASGPKDAAWLLACRSKKWVHLAKAVDYKGRTVLDVGSQCGFACFAALRQGAVSAVGIERRQAMVDLSKRAAGLFGYEAVSTFVAADWIERMPVAGRYDIVQCMGTPHYFPRDKYKAAVEALADSAKETLVLELRFSESPGSTLTVVGKQTLPTHGWLREVLKAKGFSVPEAFPVVGGARQLWIARRIE